MVTLRTSNFLNVSVYMRINYESMRGIFRGILLYEKVHGPWNIHLASEHHYLEEDSNSPNVLVRANAVPDGIIAWGNHEPIAQKLLQAIHAGTPVILINPWEEYNAIPEFHTCGRISCDSYRVGEAAAEFYLERNYRNFAFVGARKKVIWSRRRGEGFVQTLTEKGYTVPVYEPANEKISQKQDEIRLGKWLRKLPPKTGLFAAMDPRGKQVIDLCHRWGIRVPQEISVLGVDNDEFLCQMTTPALSSIHLHLEKAGYHAAEMLHRRMRNLPLEQKTYWYGVQRIEARASTEWVVVEHPLVAEALTFIRNHCSELITINDIARQFDVSRRTLEKTFRAELGRTIFQEILRQRLQKLSRLLAETDIPLSELSSICGFASDSYMGKVFKKIYGSTLLEYRLQSRTR
ncbi:MAG: DNA-binding transcriptional regulator [Planctomycetia bacterium]|nr:DNA-binding transcriptional regulator [Planctomycetia bacterium]